MKEFEKWFSKLDDEQLTRFTKQNRMIAKLAWKVASKRSEELEAENKRLKEDIKRCGENWKAIYCELKIKLEKITEAWSAEIKDKEDSVFVGEIHYKLPTKS